MTLSGMLDQSNYYCLQTSLWFQKINKYIKLKRRRYLLKLINLT